MFRNKICEVENMEYMTLGLGQKVKDFRVSNKQGAVTAIAGDIVTARFGHTEHAYNSQFLHTYHSLSVIQDRHLIIDYCDDGEDVNIYNYRGWLIRLHAATGTQEFPVSTT